MPAPSSPQEKLAAVVFVHGSGPHDRDETIGPNKPLQDLAIGLAARGIASLRYEKRTRALEQRYRAELSSPTLDDEVVDDALAAIGALSKRAGIGAVFIAGHSIGAALAPRIAQRAAAEGTPVQGIILLAAPLTPTQELILAQLRFLKSLPGSRISDDAIAEMQQRSDNVEKLRRLTKGAPAPGPLPFDAPASWWRDLATYDPAAVLLAQPKLPALLLFGGRDYQVPIREKALWETRIASRPHTMLREFPALNHLMIAGEEKSSPAEYERPGKVSAELIDAVAQWIVQTAAANAALRAAN